MDNKFINDPPDLPALLRVADVEDLGILVDYLTDQGKGRLTLKDDVCQLLVRCKSAKRYSAAARDSIANEISLFGGNTIANLFRKSGVPYAEIARDVAKHLKVNCNKNADVVTIEDGILRKIFEDAFSKMSEEEQREVLAELGGANFSSVGPAALTAAMTAAKAGGFATYKMAVIVANAVAKAILGRGLSFTTTATITRTMGIALGPIGWTITGLWTLAELASPAYRVTVPCIVQIAYMRQKALAKLTSSTCPSCNAANKAAAKFCSECGTPIKKSKA